MRGNVVRTGNPHYAVICDGIDETTAEKGGRGHPTRLLKQNAERLVYALAPAEGCRS